MLDKRTGQAITFIRSVYVVGLSKDLTTEVTECQRYLKEFLSVLRALCGKRFFSTSL